MSRWRCRLHRSDGPAIFISYRRSDAAGEAGRLRDRLADRWGKSAVFMDTHDLETGTEFRPEILRALSTSSVLIAVIGPKWCSVSDGQGLQRLRAPDDWVRKELAYAIGRKDEMEIIPLLVSGAKLPEARDLPKEVARLSEIQSMELFHSSYDEQMKTLMDRIECRIRARYDDPGIRLRVFSTRAMKALKLFWSWVVVGAAFYLAWYTIDRLFLGD